MSAPGVIRARAPGKVVLWGEYAVLSGAPALVMAVDRYALCELVPGGSDTWHLSAAGHPAATEKLTRARLLAAQPPEPGSIYGILWEVLHSQPAASWPGGGSIRFDTAGFHHQGAKLGLGSSAALTVAVYGAACRLLQIEPSMEAALAIHRNFQGGAGSGLDVAAAWHGGTLRFRRPSAGRQGEAAAWPLPAGLEVRCIWTGTSASTGAHLQRLQCWLDAGHGAELEHLAASATALFEATDLLAALATYGERLAALDRAAELGIFSAAHRRLQRLAIDAGVVYKPCGAGGGDIGAAFAADATAADRFVELARHDGFVPLALESAFHGLEVTG